MVSNILFSDNNSVLEFVLDHKFLVFFGFPLIVFLLYVFLLVIFGVPITEGGLQEEKDLDKDRSLDACIMIKVHLQKQMPLADISGCAKHESKVTIKGDQEYFVHGTINNNGDFGRYSAFMKYDDGWIIKELEFY